MKQNLKKALSLLLAVCIAAVFLPLCAAGTEDPLRLLVAADTHFQCAADLGEPDGLYREYMLDPETFVRADRSTLVNIHNISNLLPKQRRCIFRSQQGQEVEAKLLVPAFKRLQELL